MFFVASGVIEVGRSVWISSYFSWSSSRALGPSRREVARARPRTAFTVARKNMMKHGQIPELTS